MQQSLPSPSTSQLLPGWSLSGEARAHFAECVSINTARVSTILPWLAPGPPNEAWRSYVGEIDARAPDLPRLFYELALTISQFGGFIAHASDGSLVTWKREGSGIKAILATMDTLRKKKKLPQIHIDTGFESALAEHFIRVPFGRERMDMLIEVGRPSSPQFFRNMLALAQRRDGSYRFTVLHMKGLACRFPLAFGEDPIFYKKASLLLMTMEIALNQLGKNAVAATLPPADYRIPQILEGLGILSFSKDTTDKIAGGHIFKLEDKAVQAIRAMTVEAVAHIKDAYEKAHGKAITCAELDGLLYLLSRKQDLMATRTMKPHMLVTTHAF